AHAGFYPEGAGEFTAEVGAPVEPPLRVDLPARGRGIGSKMTDGSGAAGGGGRGLAGASGGGCETGSAVVVGERGRGGGARTGFGAMAGVSRGVMLRFGSCSSSWEDGPAPGGVLRKKSVITAPAEGRPAYSTAPGRGVNFGA
ncbi:hypothetical protein D7X12_38455, partial [Corallococcus sicarius]